MITTRLLRVAAEHAEVIGRHPLCQVSMDSAQDLMLALQVRVVNGHESAPIEAPAQGYPCVPFFPYEVFDSGAQASKSMLDHIQLCFLTIVAPAQLMPHDGQLPMRNIEIDYAMEMRNKMRRCTHWRLSYRRWV